MARYRHSVSAGALFTAILARHPKTVKEASAKM